MQTDKNILTDVQQTTVMHAISSFLRIALQGKSQETKTWYQARLRLVAQVLGETRPLADVLEIDLIKLREHWESQKLSPHTLHGYIRAVRRLFKWLYRRGFIVVDLSADIELPRLPKGGRKGITDEHAVLILEEAKRNSPRDYAMLLIFASANARRGGVADLKLTDLSLDQPEPLCRQIRVIEKGNKERTIIIDDQTIAALHAWLAVRPDGSEYVFVKADGEKLKVNSVSEVLDRYKQRLGITGHCSPHQWRHRWFRRMLSNGMPLAQAAQLGGHENVNVTYQYYGQFAIKELQSAYDKYYRP
ncbi:MAG: tyrosine-type recombinase/integrase [Chloroflexi bacterium]|nr:tyrosine-type recombinase/integrase [Chloroflexota bacterium]